MPRQITTNLKQHLPAIIEKNFQISKDTTILLVYDEQCKLAKILADGYKEAIAHYQHQIINYDKIAAESILAIFDQPPKKSLVILVQSLSFRITKDRLRADLFRKGHMVIEHARLQHNKEDQIETYINALEYNTPYYTRMCNKIEQLLKNSTNITIASETCGESNRDKENPILTINSPYEEPVKNTGEFYQQLIPAGGFPIGEIFTEAQQLDKINGSVIVFGFPNSNHLTTWTEPFMVTIKDGCLVSHHGPKEFDDILNLIKSEEMGKVQIREIGFGLNKALGFDKRIDEPTAFERYAGVHFSLGLKHAMYRKKFPKTVYQKYHVDIFCKADTITIGTTRVFEEGRWIE